MNVTAHMSLRSVEVDLGRRGGEIWGRGEISIVEVEFGEGWLHLGDRVVRSREEGW